MQGTENLTGCNVYSEEFFFVSMVSLKAKLNAWVGEYLMMLTPFN